MDAPFLKMEAPEPRMKAPGLKMEREAGFQVLSSGKPGGALPSRGT
jgi:hypothetical protein